VPRKLSARLYDKDKEVMPKRVHNQLYTIDSKKVFVQRIAKAKNKDIVVLEIKKFFDKKFNKVLFEEKGIYNVYKQHTFVEIKKRIDDIAEQNKKFVELDAIMVDVFKNLEVSFERQKRELMISIINPLRNQSEYNAQELGGEVFDLLSNMQIYKVQPLKDSILFLDKRLISAKEDKVVVEVLRQYFKDYLNEYTKMGGSLELIIRDAAIWKSDEFLKEKASEVSFILQEQSTTVFRFLIWRDMVREMFEESAWLGINFGKPQRSKSTEILLMGHAVWMRDGWISPHNSFFNVIYRAGFPGVVFVVAIFAVFISMVRKAIQVKSMIGILMCSIFIYWLTLANFSVVLELPYQAIPFWSLWGISWAYLLSKKKSIERSP